ncbi:MAG TPA: hypothetical protein VF461_01650 [Gemmatimonadaceae bacterium]
MFVEIVDALRCPRAHEESWLVLAAQRTEERHVLEGTLGCPVCRAEYPIHDGIADFTDPTARPDATAGVLPTLPSADHLAAMMNLGDALGFAVLIGAWGTRADELVELLDAPPLLLVEPPAGIAMGHGLSGLRTSAKLPLATGAARAVATDAVGPARVADAARVTRVGGRLVAPAASRVPEGVRELARDDTVWVGERLALASAPVTLHVRRG